MSVVKRSMQTFSLKYSRQRLNMAVVMTVVYFYDYNLKEVYLKNVFGQRCFFRGIPSKWD